MKHPIVYFDKDERREVESMSPIEVMSSASLSSEDIERVIFGTNPSNLKLISMRLYNEVSKLADKYNVPNAIGGIDIVAVIREISYWDNYQEQISNYTSSIGSNADEIYNRWDSDYKTIVNYDRTGE